MEDSFKKRAIRLKSAGYPPFLLVSVADKMLKQLRNKPDVEPREREREKLKCAVVPYLHGISHNLKKIGKRVDVYVVFSAPNKSSKLMNRVNGKEKNKSTCATQHRDRFVNCSERTVYSIPLACGKQYVGQSGRCLNDQLREHRNNADKTIKGHLGIHCRHCECRPHFDRIRIVARHEDQLTREIIEAYQIVSLKGNSVSSASLALPKKELQFLSNH